jgi:transposase
MSKSAENLPDDPAELKAMIAALQAENANISATLRVHDQLVQALRLRIAKLQKLAFGKSSEKIEREIEQLELALEDLLVAVAEEDDAPINEGQDEPSPEAADAPALCRRPRVSDATPRERRELDPGACCPDCGGDLRVVGEDISELLDMIAAQMKVIQIARIKKSCRRCERMMQEPARGRSRFAALVLAADGARRPERCAFRDLSELFDDWGLLNHQTRGFHDTGEN